MINGSTNTGGSSLVAPFVLFIHDPWGFDPCQDCERHVLTSSHTFLPHHDQSSHDD